MEFLGLLAAIGTLGFAVFGKLSDYRFRRRAVQVTGHIFLCFPRQRYTSFFIRYSFHGEERVAEYCRIGKGSLAEGQSITILIDPDAPPNSKVPEHGVASAGPDWGNCILPTTPLWAPWEFLYIGAALLVIGLWWLF